MHSDNKRLQPLVTQQQKTSRFVRPTTPQEINLITIVGGILWADHAETFWVAIVKKLKLLKNCYEIATFDKSTTILKFYSWRARTILFWSIVMPSGTFS